MKTADGAPGNGALLKSGGRYAGSEKFIPAQADEQLNLFGDIPLSNVSIETETASRTPVVAGLALLTATEQLLAIVYEALNNEIVGAPVTWSPTTGLVATGFVTAVGNGTTSIEGTSGNVTGSASATGQQVAVSVEVTPASVNFSSVGDTENMSAVISDVRGNVIVDASGTASVVAE